MNTEAFRYKNLRWVPPIACLTVGFYSFSQWLTSTELTTDVENPICSTCIQLFTTLCFGILGISIVLKHLTFSNWSKSLALTLLAIVAMAVVDEVLLEHTFFYWLNARFYSSSNVYLPIDLDYNIALCLALISFSLILSSSRQLSRLKQVLIAAASSVVIGLCLITTLGISTNLKSAVTWGESTSISLVTLLAILLVSIYLLTSTRRYDSYKIKLHKWLLIAVLPCMLTLHIGLYFALKLERESELRMVLTELSEVTKSQLLTTLENTAKAHARMVNSWTAYNYESRERHWRLIAKSYLEDFSSFNTILWIKPDFSIGYIEDKHDKNEKILSEIDKTLLLENNVSSAREDRFIFKPNSYEGDGILWLISPIAREALFEGWMVSILNTNHLVKKLNRNIAKMGIEIHALSIESDRIYAHSNHNFDGKLSSSFDFNIMGQEFMMGFHTNDTYNTLHNTYLSKFIFSLLLSLSILILILAALILGIYQSHRKIDTLFKRQSKTINTILDGLVVADSRGQIIDANASMETIFGYSRKELISNNLSLLMDNDKGSQHNSLLSQYNSNKESSIIGKKRLFRAVRKSGEDFPIYLQVTTYSSENQQYFIGSISDLTEQFISEEKLQTSKATLYAAINKSLSGFVIVSPNLHIIQANESFLTWIGKTENDLQGTNISSLIEAQSRVHFETDFYKLVNSSCDTIQSENQFISLSGDIKWGLYTASSVKNSSNCVQSIVYQIVDINKQKELETTLSKQNLQLSKVNRELEQFAFIASHDLKEPIRTLQTFSSYLIDDVNSNNLERIEQDKQFIKSSCQRMTNLIDDLLQLSRVGNSELRCDCYKLSTIVSEVIALLNSQISESHAKIIVDNTLPDIIIDKNKFSLVIQNLLSNAIKFRKENIEPIISITSNHNHEDGSLSINIKDNGIGIPKDELSNIFSAFKKLHSTNVYQGTGIGLAIVEKVLLLHGGSISVESTEGEGSVFTINLPQTTRLEVA